MVGSLSLGSSFERRGGEQGNGSRRDGGALSRERKWEEEPTTPLECIDLGDPIHRYRPHPWELTKLVFGSKLATTAKFLQGT